MTTEGDLPATPRRRPDWRAGWSSLHWGPIGVAAAGVATVALTATLLYPATRPTGSAEVDGGPPGPPRAIGTAGIPGLANPSTSSSRSASPSASGSPSAGPTPAGSPHAVSRPGGKPTADNTGYVAGSALVTINGDQTYSQNNQVVENADIHGYVRITGRNVTIRNSVVRGGAARCTAAVIQIDAGASATIEDTEITPSNPNPCLDGVWATAATLTRVNIHNVVDGVKAGNDVVLQDSWVHDLSYYATGAPGGGETLTDAVETNGKRRITLRHNVLYPGNKGDAAYQMTQQGGAGGELRIENNWVDGGHCTLNFSHRGTATPLGGIAVLNNRFGRHTMYVCPILISTQTTLSENSGNVWDDTGTAIPAPDKHD